MAILLADSNALRNPQLKDILATSHAIQIALSDVILIEMRKKNAVVTSRESLRIASQFPGQFLVLKRTYQTLDINVTSSTDAMALLDDEAGAELEAIGRGLLDNPTDARLAVRLLELQREAETYMAELAKQVEPVHVSMVDMTKEFTYDQISQLKTGVGVTKETRNTIFRLLKETTAQFFLDNDLTGGRKGILLREALGMFPFRYCLCMIIYYLLWMKDGCKTPSEKNRLNDIHDLQLATMSTYFNGVLSGDKLTREASYAARRILKGYGGYIGDDWKPPASLMPA